MKSSAMSRSLVRSQNPPCRESDEQNRGAGEERELDPLELPEAARRLIDGMGESASPLYGAEIVWIARMADSALHTIVVPGEVHRLEHVTGSVAGEILDLPRPLERREGV